MASKLMNRNFSDMLAALCEENAEFLVIGASAMAWHGFPRFTGDFDIWIRPSAENAERVWKALIRFRAPMRSLTIEDLQDEDVVFQIGTPPQRIDILTSISGVQFSEAWPNRVYFPVDNYQVPAIGPADLLRNKRASGRPKDLVDAAWLESKQQPKRQN
jgi:hypothetical protein